MQKKSNVKINKNIQKDIAYHNLLCVDWLTVIAKLSGLEISSKPIREIEKKYFLNGTDDVDFDEVANSLNATKIAILQKIPNEEGLCAINPTCVKREETLYLEDGTYRASVEAYKVAKLEKIEEKAEDLVYTNDYISNGRIKINFDILGNIDKIEVKDKGEINKDFDKLAFLSKVFASKKFKENNIKHISTNTYIEDKVFLVREDVFNSKLNSLVQQVLIKKDSLDIEFKTRIMIKDKNSKIKISFEGDNGFINIAENWPGYENLYVGKQNGIEIALFSTDAKIEDNRIVFEALEKGKHCFDFCVHIDEVEWQDSSLAEQYQSRSMPLIVSNMMPKIRPIIELDNYGVLVTKLRLSSNGKYVLVTLREMYNQECDCMIKAGFRAKGVYEIDEDHNMLAVTSSNYSFTPNQEINIAFEL